MIRLAQRPPYFCLWGNAPSLTTTSFEHRSLTYKSDGFGSHTCYGDANLNDSASAYGPARLGNDKILQPSGDGFAQDSFARPNFTINLGLVRMDSSPSEANDQFTQFDPTTGTLVPAASPITRTTKFPARIGFAWDPFKDGKTSVRGAYHSYRESDDQHRHWPEREPARHLSRSVQVSSRLRIQATHLQQPAQLSGDQSQFQ
jgi:hypothetical protein